MRNKDEKKKCKGQESTIGKIIYGFLLFLPLLAIATTCLVQTFNQNAKQQEEAQIIYHYKYETNEVNSLDDLVEGNIYNFNSGNTILSPDDFVMSGGFGFELVSGSINFITIDDINGDYDYAVNVTKGMKISFTNERIVYIDFPNDDYYLESFFTCDEFSSDCIVKLMTFSSSNLSTYLLNFISSTTYNEIESVELEQEPLDENVFYRAVDRITQSPLFNWAENSIIYTTTNATCNALSITTTFIPLLMSYWLIISVIYFLYDIALMLVWIIHRKIHELQESI